MKKHLRTLTSQYGAREARLAWRTWSLTVVALLASLLPMAAQDFSNWTAGAGSWDGEGNWDNGVPSPATSAYFNNSGTANVSVGVSSTFISLQMGTTFHGGGTVNISGGHLEGVDTGVSAMIGQAEDTHAVVNMTSGTWNNAGEIKLAAGPSDGTVNLSGGLLTSANVYIAVAEGGRGIVSVSGGTWNAADISVGTSAVGSLNISGGLVTSSGNFGAEVGSSSGARGTVLVTGGTWNNNGGMFIGASGTGSMRIEAGTVASVNSAIGFDSRSHGAVTVTGSDATWTNSGYLKVGVFGSNATLTLEDGGLTQVVGDLTFSEAGGTGNYIRLNGGYIALFSDRISEIEGLIAQGVFQVWNGTAWESATDTNAFSYGYFLSDEAAEAFCNREGLGSYTILTATSNAVPEPTTWALLGLGTAVLGFQIRRRQTA